MPDNKTLQGDSVLGDVPESGLPTMNGTDSGEIVNFVLDRNKKSPERGWAETLEAYLANEEGIYSVPLPKSNFLSLDGLIQEMHDNPTSRTHLHAQGSLQVLGILPLASYEGNRKILLGILNEEKDFQQRASFVGLGLKDNLLSSIGLRPEDVKYVTLSPSEYKELQIFINNAPARRQHIEGIDKELEAKRLAYDILFQAIQMSASDVHIEPLENGNRIRYRIDGVLHERRWNFPQEKFTRISAVYRLKAGFQVQEHLLPQDGKIIFDPSEKVEEAWEKDYLEKLKQYELRVSSIPTAEGEKLALRIHDHGRKIRSLEELGYKERDVNITEQIINEDRGIVLVTGPTGSGKTTMLYSVLDLLNKPEVNITTIEDPIEMRIPGLNQVPINAKRGVEFQMIMRNFLRQDPDIILIGEMRDPETAQTAFQAANTGHLVFSTLHTNDAVSSITRLDSLEVEPYFVNASLIGVYAQRLLRKVCPSCREPYDASKQLNDLFGEKLIKLPFPTNHAVEGKDCAICNGTGYHGRTSTYEIWKLGEYSRGLVLRREPRPSEAEYFKSATENDKMIPLAINSVSLVYNGTTTLDEVLRVNGPGTFYSQKNQISELLMNGLERRRVGRK